MPNITAALMINCLNLSVRVPDAIYYLKIKEKNRNNFSVNFIFRNNSKKRFV